MKLVFNPYEPIYDRIPGRALEFYEIYGFDSWVLPFCKASRKKLKRRK